MKVVFNLGTSAKWDNLQRVCGATLDVLSKRGHSAVPIDRNSPCIGCRACHNIKRCVLEHDRENSNLLATSDVIMVFSPIYFFGLCSTAKLFLDRLYGTDLTGKILCFVTISGSPSDSRYCGVDLIDEMAQRTTEYCGCYTVPTLNICTEDGYIDAYEHLKEVRTFIRSLEGKYNEISG